MSKEIETIINEYNSLRRSDTHSSDESLMMDILSRKGVLPYKDLNNEDHDFMLRSNIISVQFYLSFITKPFEEVMNFYGAWEENKKVIEENAEKYIARERQVKTLAM